jgi:hypothetical protein
MRRSARGPLRLRVLFVTLASALASAGALLLSQPAAAVSTRSFVLDDAASFGQGELVGVAVRSDGRVVPSIGLSRTALPPEVGLVYSAAAASDGTIFLGTGETGRIYRLRGESLELVAETGQLLVSALVLGGTTLYAGTLPDGRIYAIDTAAAVPSAPRELVRLASTAAAPAGEGSPEPVPQHVWDLALDAAHRRLFAATGPEGRVYAIDLGTGNATVYFDSLAEHVMALALSPDGALYAGTTDEALVLRIAAANDATVVYDFPGNEITALALRDGTLAVAANEFPEPPAVTGGTTTRSAGAARAARPRPGKAIVYRVGGDGRTERVWSQDDGHVTRLELDAGGAIYAATGAEGRIVRIETDRGSSVWADVDERQVLAMSLTGSTPFFATGDGAAVYRVSGGSTGRTWTSKVLDAEFSARWGGLDWRGSEGIRFETRSGNTARPDETWSDWSTALGSPGPIRSAAGRFLQLRATLPAGDAVELRAVTAYYLPENQRPVVSGVGLKRTPTKREEPTAAPAASPTLPLSWSTDNPDGDRIRYRLRFREESQPVWRSILEEHETLTAVEYAWDTSALPDGWYVVEVEASDELSNPRDLVLRSTASSEPLLVDHHPPTVTIAASGTQITGEAVDGLGPIVRLEIAIDGGDFHLVFPEDDLFDAARERFAVDAALLLPEASGDHVVAVRAFDAGGNQGSAEAVLRLGGAPARPRRTR